MDENIEQLREGLREGENTTVVANTLKLANVPRDDIEQIEPAIEELQDAVRTGDDKAPGHALSALAKYGAVVDPEVVRAVDDEILHILEGQSECSQIKINVENALIAATVSGNPAFAGPIRAWHRGQGDYRYSVDTGVTSLAYLSVISADLEWLPIGGKHVRYAVIGRGDLGERYPTYLLYVMDGRLEDTGQRKSARDLIVKREYIAPALAVAVTKFVEDCPTDRLTRYHMQSLSAMTDTHPDVVRGQLQHPVQLLWSTTGPVRSHYMWALANMIEQADSLDENLLTAAQQALHDTQSQHEGQQRLSRAIESHDRLS